MKTTTPGTKGEKTKKKIIEAAIYCIAKYGDRNTTFQKIADRCKLTQPLVVHYFKSRENIFPTVLSTILERARTRTSEYVRTGTSAKDKLRRYFGVSYEVFKEPNIAVIYSTLYYFAGFDQKYKDINTDIKQVAIARIADILESGIQSKEFRKVDVDATAKFIHNSLVGFLLNSITENKKYSDKTLLKTFENSILNGIQV